MKISVIISLINSEIQISKVINNLEEMSNFSGKDNQKLKLTVLTFKDYEYIENLKDICTQLEIDVIESDQETINKENAMKFVGESKEDYVMFLNGGDRILESITTLDDKDFEGSDLVYLNYSASNYRVNSKLLQARVVSNDDFTYDTVVWESVNNKIINRDLIINNSIDVSPLLNDEEKIEVYTELYLNAASAKIMATNNYLKLQGNDSDYLMYEEYEDQEYFNKMAKVFSIFNTTQNDNKRTLMLKASYFSYELIYGQNKERLKDINKESDENKEIYMNLLLKFLETQQVGEWESYLDIEAQGIVRAIRSKRLVTVANSYNQLALYDLYNKYKNKTEIQLIELKNNERNELKKIKAALVNLADFEEKLGLFNNKLSEIENVNRVLRQSIKQHELSATTQKEQIFEYELSIEDYRDKLLQAKEMYEVQVANCAKLKGKINKQKILIQEKEIDISRLNLELKYASTELNKYSQIGSKDQSEQEEILVEKITKLKQENKVLREKQCTTDKFQEDTNSKLVEELQVENKRLYRENQILRDGYDDLAGRLKIDKKGLLNFLKLNR